MTYSPKDLEYLIGLDQVPRGDVPAAWWVSVHPELIDAHAKWKTDYRDHLEKVRAFAAGIGVEVESARTFVSYYEGATALSGFEPPRNMTLWEGHPDHIPVPAGWRLDRKENRLVPSRKTKADRESQVNKDFRAVRKIPDVRSYMCGLPINITLNHHNGTRTTYAVNYWSGANAIMACTGADPDRSEDAVTIDTGLWQRQTIPAFLALREAAKTHA